MENKRAFNCSVLQQIVSGIHFAFASIYIFPFYLHSYLINSQYRENDEEVGMGKIDERVIITKNNTNSKYMSNVNVQNSANNNVLCTPRGHFSWFVVCS